MRRVAAVLLAAACGLQAAAQAIRFPAPVDFQTHFEPDAGAAAASGSRDGWESFPLAQEAGYDPSIQPETANGESVLVRELAPTRDGFFQLGFVRRVRLLSGEHAAIRFRLRAPYLTRSSAAHLHIFRGEADEQHDFTLQGGGWQSFSTTLNASPEPVTAIAIDVDFPDAVHTRAERVLLTDLHLEALATRHIPVLQPAALWDATRELFYLRRSLAPGQDLSVTTASAVRWTLTSPGGVEAASGTGFTLHHRLPADAQPGLWTIHMEGADGESAVLLLVRPLKAAGLVFDRAPAISASTLR